MTDLAYNILGGMIGAAIVWVMVKFIGNPIYERQVKGLQRLVKEQDELITIMRKDRD